MEQQENNSIHHPGIKFFNTEKLMYESKLTIPVFMGGGGEGAETEMKIDGLGGSFPGYEYPIHTALLYNCFIILKA
jgi:hypothetical protein